MIYFKLSEFDCPSLPGSGVKMCPVFLAALDNARGMYGKPMRITNGFRTKEYGKLLQQRGYEVATKSAHYVGAAADTFEVYHLGKRRIDGLQSELADTERQVGILEIGRREIFVEPA